MRPQRRIHGLKKAVKVLKVWQRDECHDDNLVEEFLSKHDHWTKTMINHRKLCSCKMCGNPRKKLRKQENITIQEKKNLMKFYEELNETDVA